MSNASSARQALGDSAEGSTIYKRRILSFVSAATHSSSSTPKDIVSWWAMKGQEKQLSLLAATTAPMTASDHVMDTWES